ncbi:SusC/RagA family TonB-linked outer membrane protein [Leadbetterella sp. DM7]|uniref:SusC/RagA family TonB-linked outer membrane protein n=1 Tax=Leadbetterella sp. DM7 TaxID=3235085 RepID=UPI00349E5829
MMNRNLIQFPLVLILLLFSLTALAQNVVTGRVIDAKTNEPLPGATVTFATNGRGVSTDENGNFRIEVPEKKGTLTVSFIGYNSKEVQLNASSDNLVIGLSSSNENLDEVVVVGYGTQSKRKVTGAVSSLDMTVQQNSPSVNAGQALRGRVAGVQILDNGRPGQDPSILIRGQRSLSANNAPLIVLDGIIFGGTLSDINPNDILSMDVLKDASAASIYGSRAANGVILITSKKATTEGVVITVNSSVSSYGWGKKIPFYSPERYIQSKLDYRKQSGLEADPSKIATYLYKTEADNYLNGKVTDPYDEVSQKAGMFNYDINLAGRSTKTNYYLSSSFSKEAGLLVNDNFKRQTFRANLETEVNPFIKLGLTSTYGQRDMSGVAASVASLYTSSPYGTWYYPNGNPSKYVVAEDQVSSNPLYNSFMTDNEEIYNNLLSNFYTEIAIPGVEGLSFRMNFSPNVRWSHNYNFFRQDQYLTNNTTYANKQNQNGFDWVWENIVKYNKDINRHHFDVTLLFGKNYMKQEQTRANADQLSSDALGYNDLSLGTILTNSSSAYEIRGISSMARLNYDYAGKYMATLTTRRDGSSVFAANNKYALFPSVALGWNVTGEEFMNDQDIFDNLKLRLSYGSIGNQGIDPYQSLSLSSITQYVYGNGGSMSIGAYPNIMGNDDLRWETTYSGNLGIDFSILKRRLSGTVEVYNTKTKDLLVRRSIPAMNGYLNVLTNIGEVQNKGIELSLNSVNIATPKFGWNTGFNFTYNVNKITKLYGQDLNNDGVEDDDLSNRWFIGYPINTYYDYVFDGIYQVGEEMPAGYKPGYVKLKDVNKDGKIDANDRQIIGSGGQPKFKFGLSNEFYIGNFTISTFFNAMTGWMSNFPLLNTAVSPNAPGRGLNQLDAGYWTEENASQTRPSLLYTNPQGHGWYVSRNFVRLQDLSVSYQVPESVTNRLKLRSLRVYANAKNLFTWSDWPGTDPEIGGTSSDQLYSLPRIFNLGLGFSF